MVMIEPYAPCPCGSGKKYKFCCRKLEPAFRRIMALLDRDLDKALIEIRKLKAHHPDHLELIILEAVGLMNLERLGEALGILYQAAQHHETCPRVHMLIGDILRMQGTDLAEALKEYETAARTFPEDTLHSGKDTVQWKDAFLSAAECCIDLGDYRRALPALKSALDLVPSDEETHDLMAELLGSKDLVPADVWEDAADYYRENFPQLAAKAIDAGSDAVEDRLVGIATAAAARGDMDEAEDLFQQVLEINPLNKDACLFLMHHYSESENHEGMLRLMERMTDEVARRKDMPPLLALKTAAIASVIDFAAFIDTPEDFLTALPADDHEPGLEQHLEGMLDLIKRLSRKKFARKQDAQPAVKELFAFYIEHLWVRRPCAYLDDQPPLAAARTADGRARLQVLVPAIASTIAQSDFIPWDPTNMYAALGLSTAGGASEPRT